MIGDHSEAVAVLVTRIGFNQLGARRGRAAFIAQRLANAKPRAAAVGHRTPQHRRVALDSVGHYLPAVVSKFLCRQVWMRAFRICGRSLVRGPGGANSFLDFLFSRGQRIVRDVQRALRYFGFDYAVQRFDRIGYFLLVSGISQFVDFNSSGHGFAQTRIGWITFFLHAFYTCSYDAR
jgi:hypothetical protein